MSWTHRNPARVKRNSIATGSIGISLALAAIVLAGCPQDPSSQNAISDKQPKKTTADFRYSSMIPYLKWKPEDFFDLDEQIELCRAMSRESEVDFEALLKESVHSGLDLNLQGKCGLTLLYWAFAEKNMPAYRLLLRSGANPDLKLTERPPPERIDTFWVGDSVLFTSLRVVLPAYCVEGMPYSKCLPNCVDRQGCTLLATYLYYGFAGSEQVLQAMIDAGIDLNEPGCNMSAPLHLAFSLGHTPLLALRLLEAGSDPSAEDEYGEDIVDLVERRLFSERRRGIHDPRLEPLIEWLNENYRTVDRNREFSFGGDKFPK
jgi:hypothetical protein